MKNLFSPYFLLFYAFLFMLWYFWDVIGEYLVAIF